MSLLLRGFKCHSSHNREDFSNLVHFSGNSKKKEKDFLSSSILGLIVLAHPEFLRDDFAQSL